MLKIDCLKSLMHFHKMEGAVQNYLLQEDIMMLEELVANNFVLQNRWKCVAR
jgi:hypothetical protein